MIGFSEQKVPFLRTEQGAVMAASKVMCREVG